MVLVRGVVDGEVGRPHGAGVRPHGRGLDVFCEGRGTVVEAAVLSVVSSFDPHVEGDIVGMEATDFGEAQPRTFGQCVNTSCFMDLENFTW